MRSVTSVPLRYNFFAKYKGFEELFEKSIAHHDEISVIYAAVRLEQREKAPSPIDATLSGMVILVRLEHP